MSTDKDEQTIKEQRRAETRSQNTVEQQIMAHATRLASLNAGEDDSTLIAEMRKMGKTFRKHIAIRISALNGDPKTLNDIKALHGQTTSAQKTAKRLQNRAEEINEYTKAAKTVVKLAEDVIKLVT